MAENEHSKQSKSFEYSADDVREYIKGEAFDKMLYEALVGRLRVGFQDERPESRSASDEPLDGT